MTIVVVFSGLLPIWHLAKGQFCGMSLPYPVPHACRPCRITILACPCGGWYVFTGVTIYSASKQTPVCLENPCPYLEQTPQKPARREQLQGRELSREWWDCGEATSRPSTTV